jgi:hypothetical protein
MLPLHLLLKTAAAVILSLASFFGRGIDTSLIARFLSSPSQRFLTLSMLYTQASDKTINVRIVWQFFHIIYSYCYQFFMPASISNVSGHLPLALPNNLPPFTTVAQFTSPTICTTMASINTIKADEPSNGLKLDSLFAVDKPSAPSTPPLSPTPNVLSPAASDAPEDAYSELVIYVNTPPQIKEWDPIVIEITQRVLCFAMQGIVITVR